MKKRPLRKKRTNPLEWLNPIPFDVLPDVSAPPQQPAYDPAWGQKKQFGLAPSSMPRLDGFLTPLPGQANPRREELRATDEPPRDEPLQMLIGRWKGLADTVFEIKLEMGTGRIVVEGAYPGEVLKQNDGFQLNMLNEMWNLDPKTSSIEKLTWINTASNPDSIPKVVWKRIPNLEIQHLQGYWEGLHGTWFSVQPDPTGSPNNMLVHMLTPEGLPEKGGEFEIEKRNRLWMRAFGDKYKVSLNSSLNQIIWQNSNKTSDFPFVLWKRLFRMEAASPASDESKLPEMLSSMTSPQKRSAEVLGEENEEEKMDRPEPKKARLIASPEA